MGRIERSSRDKIGETSDEQIETAVEIEEKREVATDDLKLIAEVAEDLSKSKDERKDQTAAEALNDAFTEAKDEAKEEVDRIGDEAEEHGEEMQEDIGTLETGIETAEEDITKLDDLKSGLSGQNRALENIVGEAIQESKLSKEELSSFKQDMGEKLKELHKTVEQQNREVTKAMRRKIDL